MRIFLTGASGCIGHYLAEILIQETEHELFLLVRNPHKLKFNYQFRPGIHLLQADLREIEQFSDLLKTINVAILIATAWGGTAESFETNVAKTVALVNQLDPQVCQQVIYFSTSSLLDRNNQLLQAAQHYGTDYIRSKHECLVQLQRLAIAPKITTVFPTLVFGGDGNKPYSHLSAGLADVLHWMSLVRWFSADGSFHFIHAKDIAQVVKHLVEHPATANTFSRQLVLGNPPLTVDQAIEQICHYLNKRIYLRLPLSIWLTNAFIKLFRIYMDDWSRFSLDYRHFTYKSFVNPATFNLPAYCPTVADLLKISGIPSKNR